MKKISLLVFYILSICSAFAQTYIQDNDGRSYYDWMGASLPLIYSYIPEEKPYFTQDTTGYASSKAVAKIGTFTILGFDETSNSAALDGWAGWLANKNGNHTVHQLYLNNQNAGGNLSFIENTFTVTVNDNNGNAKTLTFDLYALIKGDKTVWKNISSSNNMWNANKNMSLFSNQNPKCTGSVGSTIDFYLVSRENYDQTMSLFAQNTIKIKPNFRDYSRISYRLDNSSKARYVAGGTDNSGLSFFSPFIKENGINYNQDPNEKVFVDYDFSLTATPLASQINTNTNSLQVVADAQIEVKGGFQKEFNVSYTFTSLTNNNTPNFYLQQERGDSVITYDLHFTPHGSGKIEKGASYIWHIGALSDLKAQVSVSNVLNGSLKANAGSYSDTIVITVTSIDDGYKAST